MPTRAREGAAGLSSAEARAGLVRWRPNELPTAPRERWPVGLARQFREPMAILLAVAAAVSGLGLGEVRDAVAILAIVVLNGPIGFVQEGRATRSIEALRDLETRVEGVLKAGEGRGSATEERARRSSWTRRKRRPRDGVGSSPAGRPS